MRPLSGGGGADVFNRPATRRDYFTLAHYAYDELRRAIVSVRLEPGQWISESELTEMLGMSRTPIREAIHALQSEELIEVMPQRGMKIALISVKKVREARVVREVLEIEAVREGIRVIKEDPRLWTETAQRALSCLAEQEAAFAQGDIEGFLAADEAFHRAITWPGGNETLNAVVKQMRAHLNRIRLLSMRERYNLDELIDEHRCLVSSMEIHDVTRAVETMKHHVRRLLEDIPVVQERFPHYFSL